MKKITSLVLLAMSGAFLLASCGEQPAASSQPTGSPTDSSTPASQQVTVKFNTDGGSAIADVKVDKGGKVAKPADPTKEGYTFDKWYQDSIKVTEFDFDTPLSSDITLYASWVAATPSGSDSGSDSTPAVDPSELDDITTKYGLKNTVTGKYLSGCDPMTDKDFQGRDQAKAADVSFKAGVTFSIVDHENADAVVPAELENATDLSGKVSVSEGVYTVLADFTADVYVKTKYQDDKIYIQVK